MKRIFTITLTILFSISLFSQVSLTQLWKIKTGGGNSENAEISPDKSIIAGGNSIGEVRIYNFSDGSLIRALDWHKDYNPAVKKDGELESCYFSFDGKYLAAGGNSYGVKVWRTDTWQEIKFFSGGVCDGMAFSPDNKWFAAPSGGSLRVYRTSDWTVVATISHSCDVNSVDFSSDSKYMLSGACDKKVKITRTSDWVTQATSTGPHSVKSVRLSPDEKYYATANSDALESNVYKFPEATLVKTIKHGTDGEIFYQESVEWTPDSKYLITGGDNQPAGMVKIYDVATWSLVYKREVHSATRRCEYIARVDEYILSAGGDGYIALFKIEGTSPVPNNIFPETNITSPANNSQYLKDTTITITADATDADGTITKVEFYQGATKLGEDATSPYSYTWTSVPAGTYNITSKAWDNDGASRSSSSITIIVNAAPPTYYPIPGKVEAENYSSMSGVQLETTTDVGGGQDVGYTSVGDWMNYNIDVKTSGQYSLSFRVASAKTTGKFDVKIGSTVLASITIGNTGGWQVWKTVTANVTLTAGKQVMQLLTTGAEWNINWFEGAAASITNENELDLNNKVIKYYPNPSKGQITIENAEKSNVKIIDFIGSQMLSINVESNNENIDLTNLAKGAYFIQIIKNKSIITEKLIIE